MYHKALYMYHKALYMYHKPNTYLHMVLYGSLEVNLPCPACSDCKTARCAMHAACRLKGCQRSIITPRAHARARGYVIGTPIFIERVGLRKCRCACSVSLHFYCHMGGRRSYANRCVQSEVKRGVLLPRARMREQGVM